MKSFHIVASYALFLCGLIMLSASGKANTNGEAVSLLALTMLFISISIWGFCTIP